ncbi:MAG: transposase [Lachnospiraceae bacterium]
MSIRYSDDFKKEVVKAYMAGDKSTVQIAADYNIIKKSTISQWVNQYKEECLYTTNTTTESNEAKEIRRLKSAS